jgi:manganese oxidase
MCSGHVAVIVVWPARPDSLHMSADDRSFMGWAAFGVALAALFLGFFAIAQTDNASESAAGAGSAAEVSVVEIQLGSMKFVPQHIMAPPGRVQLQVTNVDSQVHNLKILGAGTSDLQPGQSELIDLGVLDVGVYDFECDIPGHASAGMVGGLHVLIGATPGPLTGTTNGTDHFHGFSDWETMNAAMDERALRFVTEDKSAFGGQTLEPTILPDGTKEFDLWAEIVDWEVEPGQIVEAWAYNGMVPGPHIHLEVGDRARVVFENRLPTATSIHWHGVDVPNDMDGVPPYTQNSIAPGETFVYEFEARAKAVGIWHSHSGAEQVLDGLFAAITIGQMEVPEVLLEQGFKAVPDQTINMVLNDAGVIGLTLNGKSFPATEAYAANVGDTIMVHYYNEGLMPHPMHLHQPVGWVIARDGFEMITPWAGDTFNIAPGERWTVLYKPENPGVWAWHCHILTHAERADGMFGMVTALIVSE